MGLVRQFVEFSDSLAAAVASNLSPNRPDFTSSAELVVLRETEKLLAPFEEFTKLVCKDGEPTISYIILHTTSLLKLLQPFNLTYDIINVFQKAENRYKAEMHLRNVESNNCHLY